MSLDERVSRYQRQKLIDWLAKLGEAPPRDQIKDWPALWLDKRRDET